ncbi:MAG: AMP-binding protein [Clostridia bacterium]|nr:AMP-binding protein [Clostridia bacterium]
MKVYKNYPTEAFENLKQLYLASVEKYSDRVLFKQKSDNGYEEFTYRRYGADVEALGTALCARGLSGKQIIVIGENCYAWVTSYLSVICGVGVVVPVDKEIPAEELADIAKTAEAAAIIYSPACAEKLALLDEQILPISFAEIPDLIASGNERIIAGDRTYLDAEIDSNVMSALIFTSGTSGQRKGVMLSHRNLCFNLSEMCRMIYFDREDTFLSVLPLHHVYETSCGFLCPMYRGATVVLVGSLRQIMKNMQETHPTVLLCVPLLIETIHKKIWESIRRLGQEKNTVNAIRLTNALPTESARFAAKRKLLSRIHQSFGGKLRMVISGGAPADPETLRGMRDFGIHAYQAYAMTECAPLAAINRDRAFNDASAGMAPPNTLLDIYDVQNDGIGEIRYKGDNVMLGYYKNSEKTAKVIRNGWFYTGDLGYLDEDGFLYITGRKKNVIVTADGKSVFPEELEVLLSKSSFVKETMVTGYLNPSRNDYDIIAIIHPDYAKIEKKYGKNFAQSQLDLEMKKAISSANGNIPPHKRLRTYVIRPTEFPKNFSKKIKRTGIAEEAYNDYRAKIKS